MEHHTFEQPTNERIRAFLRLEKLFKQYDFHLKHGAPWNNQIAIDSINEVLAFTTRSDIKLEALKELEQLKRTVRQDLLSSPIASQVEHLTDVLKQAKAEFTAQKKAASSAKNGKRRRKSASTTKPRKTTR